MKIAVLVAACLAVLVAAGLLLCPADGTSTDVEHETVHYVALPMNDALLDAFERDIASGHFPSPWSGNVAEVTWTKRCEVTLDVGIILPFFPESMAMSQADLARMDRAVEILKAHETRQIAFWRDYAAQVKRLGCVAVPRDTWQLQVDADNQQANFGYVPGFAEGWDR